MSPAFAGTSNGHVRTTSHLRVGARVARPLCMVGDLVGDEANQTVALAQLESQHRARAQHLNRAAQVVVSNLFRGVEIRRLQIAAVAPDVCACCRFARERVQLGRERFDEARVYRVHAGQARIRGAEDALPREGAAGMPVWGWVLHIPNLCP